MRKLNSSGVKNTCLYTWSTSNNPNFMVTIKTFCFVLKSSLRPVQSFPYPHPIPTLISLIDCQTVCCQSSLKVAFWASAGIWTPACFLTFSLLLSCVSLAFGTLSGSWIYATSLWPLFGIRILWIRLLTYLLLFPVLLLASLTWPSSPDHVCVPSTDQEVKWFLRWSASAPTQLPPPLPLSANLKTYLLCPACSRILIPQNLTPDALHRKDATHRAFSASTTKWWWMKKSVYCLCMMLRLVGKLFIGRHTLTIIQLIRQNPGTLSLTLYSFED